MKQAVVYKRCEDSSKLNTCDFVDGSDGGGQIMKSEGNETQKAECVTFLLLTQLIHCWYSLKNSGIG